MMSGASGQRMQQARFRGYSLEGRASVHHRAMLKTEGSVGVPLRRSARRPGR